MVMQGLLGNLIGGALAPRASQEPSGVTYSTHLDITDGDADYDTMAEVLAIIGALTDGSPWTKVWEKTVEAQAKYRWGFGSPATPHNQGYMFFCSINEAGSFQVGKLRIAQARASEWLIRPVKELDDRRLHLPVVTSLALATPTSIDDMQALPEKIEFPKVGQDSLLQLWYRCITASAVAEDNVGFSIPVTVYQL